MKWPSVEEFNLYMKVKYPDLLESLQWTRDHWDELVKANPALGTANQLIEAILEEQASMDIDDKLDMWEAQRKDPEWQAIGKIHPRTSYGTNDKDMMDWVIITHRLRLAWIRKWKRNHE